MGIYDYIILAVVGAAVAAAIVFMTKKKKKGGCCGGCAGCPYSSSCHGTGGKDNSGGKERSVQNSKEKDT